MNIYMATYWLEQNKMPPRYQSFGRTQKREVPAKGRTAKAWLDRRRGSSPAARPQHEQEAEGQHRESGGEFQAARDDRGPRIFPSREPHRRRLGEHRQKDERASGRRRPERHGEHGGDPGGEQLLGEGEHQQQDRPRTGPRAGGDYGSCGVAPAEGAVERGGARRNDAAAFVDRRGGRARRAGAESRGGKAARRRVPGRAGKLRAAGQRPAALDPASQCNDQRAPLAPGKRESDRRDARTARELQPVSGSIHLRRGGVEDETGGTDQRNRDRRLQQRREERHDRPALQRAVVRQHVGGDQRLAVPRPGGVEHAVGEAERDEPPIGGRVTVQRVQLPRHQMGEPRLFGEKPARNPPFAPAAALAAADREGPRRLRQRGRGPGEKGSQRQSDPLRHGQAIIAALAILKPKLVPGERLVKNDSVSFCLSASSSGFGLATDAEQPAGAETSVTGFLSSNSKSMKYSGSATRSVANLASGAGLLSGSVTWNSTRWSGRSCIQ